MGKKAKTASSAGNKITLSIPREVARQLGYYVYLYIDPRDDRPFYVGKGRGERVLDHLLSTHGESRKAKVLKELRRTGIKPRLDVLAHGLPSAETALRIEAAVIDLLGLDTLTNEVRGWRSIQLGRLTLSELISYYAAKPIKMTDPAILIRINRLYRHGMSEEELYEATRGVWKLSNRRYGAKLALAVFEGVIREVYEIESWHPAGTTPYRTGSVQDVKRQGRWEFKGRKASEGVRSRYIGGLVKEYLKPGAQNPVAYVNV